MVKIVAVSPRASIVGVPATSQERWVWGEMEGGNGIIMEAAPEDGMLSLGGRLVSTLMRVGILVGGVVVVAVRVMVEQRGCS